jgi:glycosyltransferase involved in cell wall biosynthesis
MKNPLVSVLVPVYNGGPFLKPAVESILRQTYPHLEVIIVDDGSTDRCLDTLSDLNDKRVRILTQPNAGRAVALNRGLDHASGEFCAIQDADDLSEPNRIERQVESLEKDPELAVVLTGHSLIVENRVLAPRFAGKSAAECRLDIDQMRLPAHDPTAMYRLGLTRSIRFEESLLLGAAWDHILRIGERYPMLVLPACLYSYRVHAQAATRQNAGRNQVMSRKVIERALQRRGGRSEFGEMEAAPRNGRELLERGLVTHFIESVLDLRRAGESDKAFYTAMRCIRLRPFDLSFYKPLLFSLTPLQVVSVYRSRKPQPRVGAVV